MSLQRFSLWNVPIDVVHLNLEGFALHLRQDLLVLEANDRTAFGIGYCVCAMSRRHSPSRNAGSACDELLGLLAHDHFSTKRARFVGVLSGLSQINRYIPALCVANNESLTRVGVRTVATLRKVLHGVAVVGLCGNYTHGIRLTVAKCRACGHVACAAEAHWVSGLLLASGHQQETPEDTDKYALHSAIEGRSVVSGCQGLAFKTGKHRNTATQPTGYNHCIKLPFVKASNVLHRVLVNQREVWNGKSCC